MPKKLEHQLKQEAARHKDWSEERKDAYVYGALRRTGWKPNREKQAAKDLKAK